MNRRIVIVGLEALARHVVLAKLPEIRVVRRQGDAPPARGIAALREVECCRLREPSSTHGVAHGQDELQVIEGRFALRREDAAGAQGAQAIPIECFRE